MNHLRKIGKSSKFQYRRRVPKDVQEVFGKVWVEQSLGTADRREANVRAAILTADLERQWDTLRGNGSSLQRWQQDNHWLRQQTPLDTDDENQTYPVSLEFDAITDGKRKPPPGVSQEAYFAWLRGEKSVERPRLTIRDALKVWLKERRPHKSVDAAATREVARFMESTGDTDLSHITRGQARAYRDSLVASGAAPGSVATYVAYLRTIFAHAMKEELLDQRSNPFSGLKIERTKSEEEERKPIARERCLTILHEVLAHGYDQSDWFAAVLLTTGMRPIEAYRAMLVRDAPVPHWDVPRAKTSPPRKIPVHPLLLDKEPVRFTIRPEQLRRQFNERYKPDVAYSCRHSFNDEARRVEMDLEIRLRLMGHSAKRAIGTNSRYGSPDVLLSAAKKWVDLMWGA